MMISVSVVGNHCYSKEGKTYRTSFHHNAIPCLSFWGRKGYRCIFCGKWWSMKKLNKFFNRVAEIYNQPSHSLAMQLEYISQSKLLTNETKNLMSKIGEYAEHNR